MQRRNPLGCRVHIAGRAGERTDGYRRVERPERGDADLGGAHAAHAGEDAGGIDARKLALIGRHAVGRVALGMFDMAETFTQGEAEIAGVNIVLEIDEGFRFCARHIPDRREGRIDFLADDWHFVGFRREAEIGGDGGCLFSPVGKTGRERITPGRSACNRKSAADIGREEGIEFGGPDRPRAALAGKMDHRIEAAGHADGVAGDDFFITGALEHQLVQPLPAHRIDDTGTLDDTDILQSIAGKCRCVSARVDDRRDADALTSKVSGCAISRIAIGEDRYRLAGGNAEAIGIGADRTCRHHARPVVTAEHQRPLLGAGHQQCPLGGDAPQALYRQLGQRLGDMLLHPLHRAEDIVVIPAENGGARHQRDIRQRRKLGKHSFRENWSRLLPNRCALGQQRPAHSKILLREHNAQAGTARRQRRRKTGRTGADDQQVAMGPAFFIVFRVALQHGAA